MYPWDTVAVLEHFRTHLYLGTRASITFLLTASKKKKKDILLLKGVRFIFFRMKMVSTDWMNGNLLLAVRTKYGLK